MSNKSPFSGKEHPPFPPRGQQPYYANLKEWADAVTGRLFALEEAVSDLSIQVEELEKPKRAPRKKAEPKPETEVKKDSDKPSTESE